MNDEKQQNIKEEEKWAKLTETLRVHGTTKQLYTIEQWERFARFELILFLSVPFFFLSSQFRLLLRTRVADYLLATAAATHNLHFTSCFITCARSAAQWDRRYTLDSHSAALLLLCEGARAHSHTLARNSFRLLLHLDTFVCLCVDILFFLAEKKKKKKSKRLRNERDEMRIYILDSRTQFTSALL